MIYVLHFQESFKGVQHYVGFTDRCFNDRFKDHHSNKGNGLIKAVISAGISIRVACLMEGDRTFERKIKNQKNTPRWCPCCNRNERPAPGKFLIANAEVTL